MSFSDADKEFMIKLVQATSDKPKIVPIAANPIENLFAKPYLQVFVIILSLIGYIYFSQNEQFSSRIKSTDSTLVKIVELQRDHGQILGQLQVNQKDLTDAIRRLQAETLTQREGQRMENEWSNKLENLEKRIDSEVAERKLLEQNMRLWMRDFAEKYSASQK